MKLRTIILALIYLCLPGRADAGGQIQCKSEEAIHIMRVYMPVNIFKAKAELPSQQAKVLEHILRGKPCQTPGLIRYKNKCYTPENLKLVRKEQK